MSEHEMTASGDADASVAMEQVRLLYANLPVTQIVTLLVASALVLVQWPAVDHVWASGWMICLSLTALARIFLGVYFARAGPAVAEAARWKKYFFIMAGISGIVWGSTAIALYPPDSVVHQVFLAFVLAGMVAGGITALAPMLSAFRVFALFSLAPVIARYLAQGDFMHGAMGWTGAIFLMALLVIGKRIHETLTKSLYLRFENNQLIENLTRVNDALEGRVRERTQALQEADRRKNEFIAMLAHELRNPLAPMSAAVTLMGQASTAAVRNDAVVIMRRQMQQMARLVDDLLDIGQIQNGVISLRADTVEVSHFMQMSIEMAKPMINASDQKMTVVLPSEALFVKGDEARLAQVISNILNNASKFTPPGGSIEIVAQRQPAHVSISVKDSGIGIPAQDIESIFDLFVQVDGSPERTRGGLGIGLALVKKIVGMHGGRVAAVSQGTGHGSEFVVTLPLAAESSEASPPAPVELLHKKPAGRRKILVVDDNVDAVNSLAILLRIKGHEVREAYDGPHALALASEFDPEIVVCDIGMPGMSGLEVAQRLRSLYPQGLMLIALTGYGSAEDRARSRKAGFDAHFVKPANFDDLHSAIANAGGDPSPP